jgi:hypothetical protein
MLPLRDADMFLRFAERLYGTQTNVEARRALRRIDTYRRLLALPLSISAMERTVIRSTRRDEAGERSGAETAGTERHSVVKRYESAIWRLAS